MTSLSLTLIFLANPLAVHNRAVDFSRQGKFAQAAELCRAALPFEDSSSLEAALLLRDLSRAWRGEGYLEKALAARRRELAIVQARLGEHDANIALALDGIGEIEFEQRRFTAARQSFETALRIAEESLDAASPHLAVIRNDLAAANCGAGFQGLVKKRPTPAITGGAVFDAIALTAGAKGGAKPAAKIKSSCPPIPPPSARAKN